MRWHLWPQCVLRGRRRYASGEPPGECSRGRAILLTRNFEFRIVGIFVGIGPNPVLIPESEIVILLGDYPFGRGGVMRRRVYSVGITLGLLGATALAGAAPAVAAASTPEAACGAGYSRLSSAGLGWSSQNQTYSARVYLLYSSSTGNNCVVTMRSPGWYGNGTELLEAGVQAQGGSWKKDRGNYKYYAGPVYVKAVNTCVRFTGGAQYVDNGVFWDGYTSSYGWCG